NTATLTEDHGTTVNSTASVKVCVGADLQVSKTANPSYSRDYKWEISKVADKTQLLDGGTVKYTVHADETGHVDSGWTVKGKITVTNPNNWADPITMTSLTDAVKDPNASCQLDAPVPSLVVQPGTSTDYPYTCTYSAAPS